MNIEQLLLIGQLKQQGIRPRDARKLAAQRTADRKRSRKSRKGYPTVALLHRWKAARAAEREREQQA